MKHLSMRLACSCLALTTALALSACGGGGGDDVDPDGGTTTSHLIPTPLPLGVTLYGDASDMRPIRDGATWNYTGTTTAYTGATPVSYVTTTTQSASNDTAAVESTTNTGNAGPSSQSISVLSGTVTNMQTVDFAGRGNVQTLDDVELRSPVRQNDQWTIVDQRYTDTAIDADNDGRADWLYVGVYAYVIDSVTVNLPDQTTTQAVRVMTVALSQVRYSSNGQLSNPVQSTLETWYVPGLGIVRQITKTPDVTANDTTTVDEQLASWSGLPP